MAMKGHSLSCVTQSVPWICSSIHRRFSFSGESVSNCTLRHDQPVLPVRSPKPLRHAPSVIICGSLSLSPIHNSARLRAASARCSAERPLQIAQVRSSVPAAVPDDHRPPAPLRLVRFRSGAPRRDGQRHRRPGRHEPRRPRHGGDHQSLRGVSARQEAVRFCAERRAGAGRVRAGVCGIRRLAHADEWSAHVETIAGEDARLLEGHRRIEQRKIVHRFRRSRPRSDNYTLNGYSAGTRFWQAGSESNVCQNVPVYIETYTSQRRGVVLRCSCERPNSQFGFHR